MEKEKFKVDFIGIGAPKSATSWIYQCLKEHPEVCVSKQKETLFFWRQSEYKKGIKYYRKYFNDCGDKIKGEFSANYLAEAKSSLRIKKHFPNTKIIVCLRDPVQRVYSHYYYDKARGKRNDSFKESLETTPAYLNDGLYYTHLKKYFKLFPKENILVLIYEDIEKDPKIFIQNIYKFLKIKKDFIPPSLNKKINLTSKNKLYFSPFNDLNFKRVIKNAKKNLFGQTLIKFLKLTQLSKIIIFLKKKNLKGELDNSQKALDRPPINSQDKKNLYLFYKKEIEKLEKLLNKDLSIYKYD